MSVDLLLSQLSEISFAGETNGILMLRRSLSSEAFSAHKYQGADLVRVLNPVKEKAPYIVPSTLNLLQ